MLVENGYECLLSIIPIDLSLFVGAVMTQVIKTTNELIVNALYLTGELGVGETPDAYMLSSGLDLLNEILGKLSSDGIFIPYIKSLSGTFTAGKSEYTISNLLSADITSSPIVDLLSVTYTFPTSSTPNIVYPIRIIDQEDYYDLVRQQPLATLPAIVFLRQVNQQSILTFYPAPNDSYPFQLQAKVMLDSLTAQDSLTQLPPLAYGFLKYALARRFISIYPSANWPQTNEDEYQSYYSLFKATNKVDMTIQSSTMLNGYGNFYWQKILAYP
jgi:hypothetical protein